MPTLTYPGVYIEEFTPGAPIEGVGTSTAAFIGPSAIGELNEPTKITSFDQFRSTFGSQPLPGFYLWYAVRGFFENNGHVCYIVRASKGDYDGRGFGVSTFDALQDRLGNELLRVRARRPGKNSPPIQVSITTKNRIDEADGLYRPHSEYVVQNPTTNKRELTLTENGNPSAANAAQFRPGDWVDLGTAGHKLRVLSVSDATVRLASDMTGPADPLGMRLADIEAGTTRTVRLRLATPPPAGALIIGTILTITQDTTTESGVIESVQLEPLATQPALTTYRVTFRTGLSHPFSLADGAANDATIVSEEFDFEVRQGTASKIFENLCFDPAHLRYYLTEVNKAGTLVKLEPVEPPPPVALPDGLPDGTGLIDLGGGADENLASMGDAEYKAALKTLEEVDDVNMIAIPDRRTTAVQQELIEHCERMGERFAVLDAAAPDQPLFGDESISLQRPLLESARGYAAVYYPWLRVPPAGAGGLVFVPPSGHVCGVMARSDSTRGVHKAPANEIVNGAVGVARTMSDIDHGQLNLDGIDVIRIFQGAGRPMVFGARTTSSDTNWQYVNIRRLFLFLEESIQEGIRWAVFEPNNLQLWQKLRRTITEFLTRVWRDGGLFGATPEDAFYVRIDEVLNPFSEQALGRLHIEIGVRPSYPAEFIVVRIGIWPGGSEITEG